jgi:hypothetical protein
MLTGDMLGETMYCTDCGTLLPEMARYCPSCGRPAATGASGSVLSGPSSGTSSRAVTGERILPANTGAPLPRAEAPAHARHSSLLADFLVFRTMITPVIIWLLFWIGVAVCILGGIGVMVASLFAGPYASTGFLLGLGVLVLGPLGVRMYCELLILFFRINETLTEIKHVLEERYRED